MKRERTDDGASSSSSANPQGYGYEVFLSFRGTDTRKGFTDHLYTSLTNAGIRTFRDNEELRVGEEIGGNLLEAIAQSKIFIPIFSKNYASSKWCLKEAAHMVQCKNSRIHLVLPVFYDVTPGQVRHQSGTYEEAFKRHSEGPDEKTVPEWRNALAEIGSMKGWEVQNVADGHEGELVKLMVSKVWRELKKAHLVVEDHTIKLEDSIEEVMRMLSRGAVGIYGIGGIGKTTLAKIIYNQLLEHFEYSSFLKDVREMSSQPRGLEKLQTQLVNDMLRSQDLQHEFASVDGGIKVLSEKFRDKKVLILLDDVDNIKQIDALAADLNWFAGGSRIIITTRDKNVLDISKVKETYEARLMHLDEALHLFNMHAFKGELRAADYIDLSKEIIATTGRLPLAVEIIGSYLSTKKRREIWEDTLEKLRKCPDKDVQEKLMISYRALDSWPKEIFLDIACFFIGTDKRIAAYMWKDCGFHPEVGVDVLLQRSLIKIGDDNKLWMHDQLRDLGRAIVRNENISKPGKRSRLWSIEDVRCVLENQEATGEIEAIQFDCGIELEDCPFTREQPMNLPNVRFLRLDRDKFSSRIQCRGKLSWLQWHGAVMERSLSMGNLVILDLSRSHVTDDWSDWNSKQLGVKLKVLILECCNNLLKTPDLSKFQKLERLSFEGCAKLSEVGPSIGKLENLIFLNLRYCFKLEELPKELNDLDKLVELYIDGYGGTLPNLEGLKKLRLLSASGCEELTHIPSSINKMTSLLEVSLDRSEVQALPDSIKALVELKCLSLRDCPVEKLPDSIGQLTSLEKLFLSGSKIQALPDSIGNLTNLQVLLIDKTNIVNLPSTLEMLEKLEVIDASGCRSLQGEIYIDLKRLYSLKTLKLDWINITMLPTRWLEGCNELQTLPQLPASLHCLSVTCKEMKTFPDLSYVNLLELGLTNCIALQRIHGLSKFVFLKILKVSECENLIELDGLKKLKCLRELCIFSCVSLKNISYLPKSNQLKRLEVCSCKSLRSIPNLSTFKMLRYLSLSGSEKLRMVEGLKELESLRDLNMKSCKAIENLPNLSKLVHLLDLNLEKCEKLRMVEGLGEIRSLQRLNMKGCKAIESIPNLSKLVRLEALDLEECEKLRMVEGLGELESLGSLNMKSCKAIESIPNLSKLVRLWKLDLEECEKLRMVEGLGELESLGSLNMKGCKAIESIPNLSKLVRLGKLDLEACEKLRMVEGLGELESLGSLNMKGCKAIESIPNLSKLVCLGVLDLEECEKLCMVEGFGELESLGSLNMKGCKAIESIPNMSKLVNLHKLDLEECKKLRMVEGLGELESLEYLKMEGCKAIESIPNLSKLVRLWVLDLEECKKLHMVEGLGELESLEYLYMKGCKAIESIPNLSKLVYLRRLGLECEKLRMVEGLGELESLEYLNMKGCKAIESIPNLSKLVHLEVLDLEECEKLRMVEGLGELESLEYLNMKGCNAIESIPNLLKLVYLRRLGLECEKLRMVEGLGELESLEYLNMKGCKAIESISNLSKLVHLEVLDLEECEKLCMVEGLGELESLEYLNMKGCKAIESIPNLSKLVGLKELNLVDCKKLKELHGLEELKSLKRVHIGCSPSLYYYAMEWPHISWDPLIRRLIFVDRPIGRLNYLHCFKYLRYLSLKSCKSLRELPSCIGWIVSLEELDLSHTSIDALPDAIGELSKLKVLNMSASKLLRKIPSSIGGCRSLKKLDLSHMSIHALPDSIGALADLEVLNMSASNIEYLPRALGKLEKLQVIDVSYCRNLHEEIIVEPMRLLSLREFRMEGTNTTLPPSIFRLLRLRRHWAACRALNDQFNDSFIKNFLLDYILLGCN